MYRKCLLKCYNEYSSQENKDGTKPEHFKEATCEITYTLHSFLYSSQPLSPRLFVKLNRKFNQLIYLCKLQLIATKKFRAEMKNMRLIINAE